MLCRIHRWRLSMALPQRALGYVARYPHGKCQMCSNHHWVSRPDTQAFLGVSSAHAIQVFIVVIGALLFWYEPGGAPVALWIPQDGLQDSFALGFPRSLFACASFLLLLMSDRYKSLQQNRGTKTSACCNSRSYTRHMAAGRFTFAQALYTSASCVSQSGLAVVAATSDSGTPSKCRHMQKH